ncbi:hypothetical protein K0M31_006085 [Melipona bicolor]|uniref:Uncharacterized protein n=1 Tax=Melipona bicolor TaxID=60889 RepID=A0AA40KLE3_9HYME|nr:hypothetical protein K0M31_006085 [Melipona bicolor]
MLQLYSLFILILDLVILSFKIFFAVIIALYRISRPPPLKSLNREVAVVVGAGQGIGREMVIHLAKFYAKVACIDINKAACNTTVELAQVSAVGITRTYICNITDKNEVTQTVKSIRSELGEITMFFHCCSIPAVSSKVLSRSQEDQPEVKNTVDLAILSYLWLLEMVLPSMELAGKGHVVILSSVAAFSTTVGQNRIPLSAAQFAVQGLAKSLQTEFRRSNNNIIVTLVHIYPFVLSAEVYSDIRFRIPSYFGAIPAKEVAKQILDGVRRNYLEFSVPGFILYLGNISRIFPKEVSFMVSELLHTGIDFG